MLDSTGQGIDEMMAESGGMLDQILARIIEKIPSTGSAADQCNPNMVSIQDMLLNVFNPCVMY